MALEALKNSDNFVGDAAAASPPSPLLSPAYQDITLMEQPLGNLLLILVFSCAYCAGTTYAFFLVWFRFPELQAKLIKRNEAHIRSRWSFAYMANVWLHHWSYKWLARFNTLLLLLVGWVSVFVSLYGLVQVLKA